MDEKTVTYSVAIRTLGTGGEKFREELLSISRQTIRPDKVVVYIAEGYPRPEFTIGEEEYVWVPKGMMAQRILPYDEIESELILMLDDDVRLAPDTAEKLIEALEENKADCVGADVFKNHLMPFGVKLKAAVSDFVFPHLSRKWAFKVRRNGSFSYNLKPEPRFYLSQSAAGPVQLWKKQSFSNLHLSDELWLDSLGFPFAEDRLMTYKLFLSGGTLGVLYGSGVDNLDGGTSSGSFKKSPEWVRVRTKASFMVWWRMCYRNGKDTLWTRFLAASAFAVKSLWMLFVMAGLSVVRLSPGILSSYIKGFREAARFCSKGFVPRVFS